MKHSVTSYNTRKHLSVTLKEIMKEKDVSKISISEVAEAAGINRKTFYYHFNDIYDLLAWTLDDEALKLAETFDLTVDYDKAIKFMLDYIEANRLFVESVIHSRSRHGARKSLYESLRNISLKVIDKAVKRKKAYLEDEYKSFVAGFSTQAVIGTILYWIDNPEYERAKLEKYLVRVFRVTVENLVADEVKH